MTTDRRSLDGEGRGLDSLFRDTESFVYEVVSLVAEMTGRDPLELPPLFDAVDPESLQRVLQSGVGNGVSVSFQYAGCEILVTGDRDLVVLEHPDPPA